MGLASRARLIDLRKRHAELAPLLDREFFEEVTHPVSGPARYSTMPMRFSSHTGSYHRRPAPLLGADTRSVLAGLGLEDAELDALARDGVIGGTSLPS